MSAAAAASSGGMRRAGVALGWMGGVLGSVRRRSRARSRLFVIGWGLGRVVVDRLAKPAPDEPAQPYFKSALQAHAHARAFGSPKPIAIYIYFKKKSSSQAHAHAQHGEGGRQLAHSQAPARAQPGWRACAAGGRTARTAAAPAGKRAALTPSRVTRPCCLPVELAFARPRRWRAAGETGGRPTMATPRRLPITARARRPQAAGLGQGACMGVAASRCCGRACWPQHGLSRTRRCSSSPWHRLRPAAIKAARLLPARCCPPAAARPSGPAARLLICHGTRNQQTDLRC